MKRGLGIRLGLLLALLMQQYLAAGQQIGKGGKPGPGKGAGQPNGNKKWTKTTTTTTTITDPAATAFAKNNPAARLGSPKQACNWFNKERAKAMPDSCPVVNDEKLNKDAKKCSDYYADQQKVDYNCPFKGDAGEMAFGSKKKFDMRFLSRSFTSDAKDFDYSKPNYAKDSPNMGTWSDCNKMGFGRSSKKGFTVAVTLVISFDKPTTTTEGSKIVWYEYEVVEEK